MKTVEEILDQVNRRIQHSHEVSTTWPSESSVSRCAMAKQNELLKLKLFILGEEEEK